MIGILVFSRGLFPEELCLPDQSCSCSSSCSCLGSYQARPIQSLDGGHNREKDSNSQNEETSGGRRLRLLSRAAPAQGGGTPGSAGCNRFKGGSGINGVLPAERAPAIYSVPPLSRLLPALRR